jgi:hypothetical protein
MTIIYLYIVIAVIVFTILIVQTIITKKYRESFRNGSTTFFDLQRNVISKNWKLRTKVILAILSNSAIWPLVFAEYTFLFFKVILLDKELKKLFAFLSLYSLENLRIMYASLLLCILILCEIDLQILKFLSAVYIVSSSSLMLSYILLDSNFQGSPSLFRQIKISIFNTSIFLIIYSFLLIIGTGISYAIIFTNEISNLNIFYETIKQVIGPVSITMWLYGYIEDLTLFDILTSLSGILISTQILKFTYFYNVNKKNNEEHAETALALCILTKFERAHNYIKKNQLGDYSGLTSYAKSFVNLGLGDFPKSFDSMKLFLNYDDRYVNDMAFILIGDLCILGDIYLDAPLLNQKQIAKYKLHSFTIFYLLQGNATTLDKKEILCARYKKNKESMSFLKMVKELDKLDSLYEKCIYISQIESLSLMHHVFKSFYFQLHAHFLHKNKGCSNIQLKKIEVLLRKDIRKIVDNMNEKLNRSEILACTIISLYFLNKLKLLFPNLSKSICNHPSKYTLLIIFIFCSEFNIFSICSCLKHDLLHIFREIIYRDY